MSCVCSMPSARRRQRCSGTTRVGSSAPCWPRRPGSGSFPVALLDTALQAPTGARGGQHRGSDRAGQRRVGEDVRNARVRTGLVRTHGTLVPARSRSVRLLLASAAACGESGIVRRVHRSPVRDRHHRILDAIAVPTQVLHRTGDRVNPVSWSQRLADSITEARFVELEGQDWWPFLGDADGLLDELERFVVGSPVGPQRDSSPRHRRVHRHRELHRACVTTR